MSADRYAPLRDDIVACARAQIERQGVGRLRAREVAAAARCALGTLYNVFKDLDEIVLAVNAQTLQRLDGDLRAHAQADADPRRLVLEFGHVYITFAFDRPTLWQALFMHRMSDGRAVPTDYVDRYEALLRLLEAPLARLAGAADADDLHALSRTLFSAVHGITLLALEGTIDTIDRRETIARFDRFLAIYLAGLAASHAPGSSAARPSP